MTERARERASLHLDLEWDYDDALAWMRARRDEVIAGGRPVIGAGFHTQTVVSLGRHTPEADAQGAQTTPGAVVRRVERGGGATVHNPGQLVVYPIVPLARLGLDVVTLTDRLEAAIVAELADAGIEAAADRRDRGVFVAGSKIASIGFRVHRDVVTHGLALNVDNDLEPFSHIVTCGVSARPMTSMVLANPTSNISRRTLAYSLAQRVASSCLLELL
jgi:lipoate-protein ligase B